jgi:hypothetical protein
MNVLGLMRCNKCDKVLEKKEFVALTYLNTIFHSECGLHRKLRASRIPVRFNI